jgi:hypothetical protein
MFNNNCVRLLSDTAIFFNLAATRGHLASKHTCSIYFVGDVVQAQTKKTNGVGSAEVQQGHLNSRWPGVPGTGMQPGSGQ